MERFSLVIHDDRASAAKLRLTAPSIKLALLVADINMTRGVAEIWRGGKLLARFRKRHGLSHPLWELA
jgi:hypothetical protein